MDNQIQETELCIYHKKDDSSPYKNVAGFIAGDQLPTWNIGDHSSLLEFDILLRNPRTEDNKFLEIKTGAEICLTENQNNQGLLNSMSGKILRYEIPNIRYDFSNGYPDPNVDIHITVRQTDFSSSILNINKITPVWFSDLLKEIIFTNTRDELGGILPDGTVVPKFVLLDDDVELANFEGIGPTKDVLTLACEAVGYQWKLHYYCQNDEINKLKVIQQIIISKI